MKKTISLIAITTVIFLLLVPRTSVAQEIKAVDLNVKIDKEKRPGFSVACDAEIKPLQSAWAAYLKKNFKLKVNTGRNEVSVENASIPSVSAATFNLLTTYKLTAEGCEMIVTAAAGGAIYFSASEHPEDFKKLKTLVIDFVKSFMVANYDGLIKEKQKVIDASVKEQSSMEKEIKKLGDENEKAAKTIEDLQKQIEKNNATIQRNKEMIPTMKETIEQKKTLLKALEEKRKSISGKK